MFLLLTCFRADCGYTAADLDQLVSVLLLLIKISLHLFLVSADEDQCCLGLFPVTCLRVG